VFFVGTSLHFYTVAPWHFKACINLNCVVMIYSLQAIVQMLCKGQSDRNNQIF